MLEDMDVLLKSYGIDLDDTITFNLFFTAIGVVFWQCFFCLKYVFHPIAKRQVWYDQVCVLEETAFSNFGVVGLPADKYGLLWVQVTLVLFQHLFGSLLCFPMLLGYEEYMGISAIRLNQLGAICEFSWEIQDLLWWISTVLTDKDFGSSILIMMGGHHICALCCVVPMNLYYSHHWEYCAIVFSLQLGAVVGVGSSNFGFTFDVTQKTQLIYMWLLCLVNSTIVPFTRGPAHFYLCYRLFIILWTDGASWLMMCVGTLGFLAMSLFNIIFITDSFSRIAKWTKVLFFSEAAGKEFKTMDSALEKKKA